LSLSAKSASSTALCKNISTHQKKVKEIVLPIVVSQFRGNLHAVEAVLSQPRFQTYLVAKQGSHAKAMDLYEWNAKISNALFFPMHVCEVAIRNAASEAISAVFGQNWPYLQAFWHTLPNIRGPLFNPRKELEKVAARYPNAPGKVIADLKFVFWESIFTSRFDVQIWHRHILNVLPNSGTYLNGMSPGDVRGQVHTSLELIRKTRNRIAHHEPVFSRNLQAVLDASMMLIQLRCQDTHQWVTQSEEASKYIQNPV